MDRNFRQLLESKWDQKTSVCVGLDSNYDRLPDLIKKSSLPYQAVLSFNQEIIQATHDLVCAYKIQIAYYESLGAKGIEAMIETVKYINKIDASIPIILDAKRADIDSTNEAYAQAIFDVYSFDAVTLNPYLGQKTLEPFLMRKNKGLIILCRTSNPGAEEFQDLIVSGGIPLWQHIAKTVSTKWDQNNNCSLVVGATYPAELEKVREIVKDMPILIPGIGSQGGDLSLTVKAGRDKNGRGMIINSSRGIIFASSGPDFAKVARAEALTLKDEINKFR